MASKAKATAAAKAEQSPEQEAAAAVRDGASLPPWEGPTWGSHKSRGGHGLKASGLKKENTENLYKKCPYVVLSLEAAEAKALVAEALAAAEAAMVEGEALAAEVEALAALVEALVAVAVAEVDADAPSNSEAANEGDEAEATKEDDDSKPPPSHASIEGASPGKIFVGGLPKETTAAAFTKHLGKYGEITDSVIMKDRRTGHPRGFGFITYDADPSVVDKVIVDTHVFSGKTVEITRTIPKGARAIGSKNFKTKKIFVGGIPTTVTEDEFKNFFAKFGTVKEHLIMRDHSTNRSRGFGFVTFDTEQAVDDLLTKGNKIDFAGAQVEIKKAEPKKPSNPLPPASKHFANPRPAFGGGARDAFGSGGFGAGPYMPGGCFAGRAGAYGGYLGSEFDGGYGDYGPYRGETSLGYSGHYRGGFGRDYDIGGYDRPTEGYGRYGGYNSGLGSGYGGVGGYPGSVSGSYASRRGYGADASGRFHPY